MCDQARSSDLLDWYDSHARQMPWRVPPALRKSGQMPDPYGVWLSEVMLQQTTVAAVTEYFRKFMALWPTLPDLASAKDEEVMAAWAGLGYYARARNLLKCARVLVAEHGGEFPQTRDALQKLPGIGPYTSAAIASIAFDEPAVVVDGNVERVMSRLYAIETPLPTAKPELTARAAALTPNERPGDHAQAVMDLGATICTPTNPACGICPWRMPCKARAEGIATQLPRKLPKTERPVRRGFVYVAQRSDGAWLLEQRAAKGLLGGMMGWPGSEWQDAPQPAPPFEAKWRTSDIEVRHTFTHFHLILTVCTAKALEEALPNASWRAAQDFRPADLPTVFRKVFDAAKHHFVDD